jgi:glycosyltransferase involved in cell wall biosynthesis
MNICFVNSTNKWGGVKSWTLDVARGLADRGHDILIVGRPGPFIDKARETGLDALGLSFGPDFNPLRIFGFLKLFKTLRIDLVVVNVGKDMRCAGIAAKMLGIPVVHRVGLAGDMLNTYKVRILHKWIQPRILVPCEQIKKGLLQELTYLDRSEITVILTGKEPAGTAPTTINVPLRFISTSQLNADKGHKDILLALRDLKDQGLHFEYHVVGTGRIEAELKRLATGLELDDRVVWHGFQKDVRSFLRRADVFLLPSRREGLPNTLLEAMAEGLVCLARNVGGVEDCWPQGEAPLLLAEQATRDDFARAMSGMLAMPQENLLTLKTNFWTHAASNSLHRMTDRMEDFFHVSVLGNIAFRKDNTDVTQENNL